MSDQPIELTRRKALAALGTVGVASAGAGLGTTAFFSDREDFEGNSLTAGSLDLKVDFEEHYADWINNRGGDGSTEADLEVEMGVPQDEADIYLPPGPNADDLAEPISLRFPNNTVAEFKDATSIDAYPDTNDDGIQDFPEGFDICEEDADTPDLLDSDLRTEQYRGEPVVALDDVKPGDFGEVTLSFHLCNNPGFVWFYCNNFSEAENGFTEPELDDPDEDGPGGEPELAEQIEVRAWYDDGDNIYEPGAQAIDVYHLIDTSGTMEENLVEEGTEFEKDDAAIQVGEATNAYLDGLGTTVEQTVAVMAEAGASELLADSTDTDDVDTALGNTAGAGGGTLGAEDFVEGLENALADLVTDDTDDENDDNVIVVYTNGDSRPSDATERANVQAAADNLKNAGVEIKIVAFGNLSPAQQQFHTDISDEVIQVQSGTDQGAVDTSIADAIDEIENNFEVIEGGEQEFFRGTLEDFCNQYEFDPENGSLGFPLDGDVPAPEGGGSADARNCYSASTPHYIGFDWWLPLDHANEIQTDSVQFDLGFYTEQCRHNNGSGQGGGVGDPEIPSRTGTGFGKLSESENQNNGYGDDGEDFDTPNAITSRARNGNGGWEVGIGSGDTPSEDTTDASWSFPLSNVPWSLSYDSSDGTTEFNVGATTVSRTTAASAFDGRLLVQTKADEATVNAENVSLSVDGNSQTINGPTSVQATNDDDGGGRAFNYLVLDTALDGSESFELSGELSVSRQGDFPGGDEGWAVDVSAE
nr:choice-of-anchor W domain-containing protein [Salinirubrum litoreum]